MHVCLWTPWLLPLGDNSSNSDHNNIGINDKHQLDRISAEYFSTFTSLEVLWPAFLKVVTGVMDVVVNRLCQKVPQTMRSRAVDNHR